MFQKKKKLNLIKGTVNSYVIVLLVSVIFSNNLILIQCSEILFQMLLIL